MKCPKCGARLWKKEDKCPKCGESLAGEAETETETEEKKPLLALKLKKDDKDGDKEKTDTKEKKTVLEKDRDKDKKDLKEKAEKPEKPEKTEKVKRGLFGKKEPAEIEVKSEKKKIGRGEKSEPAERTINLKLILIAAAVVAVVLLTVIIVVNYRSAEGERYAENAYDYIGRNIRDLNDAMTGKLYYADSSQYAGVNNAVKFDYIAESEKTLRAGGVKYPKWAVTIKNDKNGGFISDVIYTDFSVVKGDMRGIKTDGLINLDRFSEGEKKSSVLREIKPRPYSIACSQTGIILYTYKYWYKLDNGDEQAAILRVGFSEKGDFKYSTTELIIPPNM